jgi:hypothetical protein
MLGGRRVVTKAIEKRKSGVRKKTWRTLQQESQEKHCQIHPTMIYERLVT